MPPLVELKGGLIVDWAVVLVLLALEDAGITVLSTPTGLRLSPPKRATPDQLAFLKVHRLQVLALLAYDAPSL